MAIMIPDTPPGYGPGKRAEGRLYEAFESNLRDDGWYVYYGLHLLTRQGAQEREADFLLVHRTKGMLLVECKGRGVERHADGRWYRMVDGRRQRTKDPMEQAQRAMHDLRRALADRMNAVFGLGRKFPFMTGHTVAFPLAEREQISTLPLNWQPEILFDCEDLLDVDRWVDGALSFWSKRNRAGAAPLSPEDFARFRKRVIHPEFRIVPSLRGDIAADQQRLLQLSEEQRHAGELVVETPRLNILGAAGTGKTVAALDGARLLAETGLRVLLVCYNRALADQLAHAVREMELPDDQLVASSFHVLCSTAHRDLTGTRLPVPAGHEEARRFFAEESYKSLLESVNQGSIDRFDAIIVDEGQDFFDEWWLVLDDLLCPEGPQRLYVFYDPGQAIFEHGCDVPEGPTIRFPTNYRNTKALATAIDGLGEVRSTPHLRAPVGTQPQWNTVPSPRKLIRGLAQRIDELTRQGISPDRIVILTVHSKKNSPLADLKALGEYPLVSVRDRRVGALTHATIWGFKGLEADVVFCIEADVTDPLIGRALRYVAASRSRHLFYLYSAENWFVSSVGATVPPG